MIFLFLELNKKHVGLRRCNLFSGFLLQLNVLILYCKIWTILALYCDAFIACHKIFINFSYSAKKTMMSIKQAKFSLFCCHCWWQRFFLLMYSQICCEIRLLWWNKFMKSIEIKWNLIKFLMKKYKSLVIQFKSSDSYTLCSCSYRQVVVLWG